MDKPDVDVIEGLSPAITIEQKATSHNPRSTVGTVTEIHDYLRLLFARAGTPFCPDHDLPLQAQSVSQMVDAVLALPADTRLMVLAPVVRDRKGEFAELFARHAGAGLRALSRRRRRPVEAADAAEAEEDREARHRRRRSTACARSPEHRSSAWPRASRRRCASPTGAPSRSRSTARPRAPVLAASSPARCAATRCPSSSRGCSRSTRRSAPARRCDGLGAGDGVRRRARGRLPVAEPGQRRGQGLGPAQRLHLLAARERGRATTASTSTRRSRSCRDERAAGAAARLGQRGDRVRLRGRGRAAASTRRSSAGIRSKASCRTSSGACARPIRPRCARTWRATRAPSPAPTATARACGARRATCSWSTPSRAARGEPIFEVEHCTLRECLGLLRDAAARRAPRPRSPTRWCARSARA